MAKNIVIIGAQWGDEGKGKIVDLLSQDVSCIVRFQGGNNAGHTVVVGGKKYALHLVPSGILHPDKICLIGNGVVLDPFIFVQELDSLAQQGLNISPTRLKISGKCHLIMPYHKVLDSAREQAAAERKIGTTGRGIGPCYEDKVGRRGIRAADLANPELLKKKILAALEEKNSLFSFCYGLPKIDPELVFQKTMEIAPRLTPYLADISSELENLQAAGKSVMFEGAQGVHLDIDHGTYPFVTSSNTVSSNAAAGCGIAPQWLNRILGVLKAYTTRVGAGPFPTELHDATGEQLRQQGGEFGTTTGRPRRCGWQDIVLLRESVRLNGFTEIALTKLDVLSGFSEIKFCVAYLYHGKRILYPPQEEDGLDQVTPIYETMPGWTESLAECTSFDSLPQNAQAYVLRLEELAGVPVSLISVGSDRNQTFAK